VGEVSQKLGRGRHTTRETRLFSVCGGLVADTPGFADFDPTQAEGLTAENLAQAFLEFSPYLGTCQYDDCAHDSDAGCAVRAAQAGGKIALSRYENYCALYTQLNGVQSYNRNNNESR
jgi:ribosome biogenesis GTPase